MRLSSSLALLSPLLPGQPGKLGRCLGITTGRPRLVASPIRDSAKPPGHCTGPTLIAKDTLPDRCWDPVGPHRILGMFVGQVVAAPVKLGEEFSIAQRGPANIVGARVGRHPYKCLWGGFINPRKDEIEHPRQWAAASGGPLEPIMDRIDAKAAVDAILAAAL